MIDNRQPDVSNVWSYVSSFFGYLDEESRSIYEFFWRGIFLAALDMTNQASRFALCADPEQASSAPILDFLDLQISVLGARPLYLDPTDYSSKYIIVPTSIIKAQPVAGGRENIRNDLIRIEETDYDKFEAVLLAHTYYVVVKNSNPSIPIKYFKVSNLLGPNEIGDRYYPYYVIQTDGGNFDYIPSGTKTTIYFTDARTYTTKKDVIDLPELSTSTTRVDGNSNTIGHLLQKDVDYSYQNGVVEFNKNLIELEIVKDGDYLYAMNVSVMESNLYSGYGSLVSISDWSLYGYDNISGKAAINTLIRSLQTVSDSYSYESALNIYYGLQTAPDNCLVMGLFESYEYLVTAVGAGDNWITVQLKDGQPLHHFIQPGTRLIISGTYQEVDVTYSDTESTVLDRVLGNILLVDKEDIVIGDKISIRLPSKSRLTKVTYGSTSASKLQISHWTSGGDIKHLNDIIYGRAQVDDRVEHPEFLVWDSIGSVYNFDGYYHITDCQKPAGAFTGLVDISIDDYRAADQVADYNDFVDPALVAGATTTVGYVHIPWPTHKYLLLKLSDQSYYKIYLDAPIDCIFDEGDRLVKYQPVARCINQIGQVAFPAWNQFSGFKRSNGIDVNSSVLELMATIPYAKFGEYFANSI
jgi:hypothetical protein